MHKFILIVLTMGIALSCNANDKDLQYANKMAKISMEHFLAVYEQYGKQLRLIAALEACDLPELAKSIKISNDKVLKTLVDNYNSLPASQTLTCPDTVCEKDRLTLASINGTIRGAYILGYSEAMEIVIKGDPDMCLSIVKMTNDILKN